MLNGLQYLTTWATGGRIYWRMRSREALHSYWRSPHDGQNLPVSYLRGKGRSVYLEGFLRRGGAWRVGMEILELGCNVGRNLDHLRQAGQARLSAIEISERAVEDLRRAYPDLASSVRIHLGSMEECLPTLPAASIDLCFTMTVLEHLHPDSEGVVFPLIGRAVRPGGWLCTVEDERAHSWRHRPRDYRRVFESLGWRQVHEEIPQDLEPGFTSNLRARLFRREEGL